MDAGQAWDGELDDLDEPPVEDLEYWADDELDAEPAGCPQAEGSVPDLIAAVLDAGGDPALMTDAELVDSLAGWHAVAARAAGRELRATEELLRRRKPRVWDRRADRAETRREEPDGAYEDPSSERGAPGSQGAAAPGRAVPTVVASREAAAEIALALTATEYGGQVQAELAADLSRRLPRAFEQLDSGRADLARVRVSCDGRVVADHERCWARHQTLTDPAHLQAAKALRSARRLAVVAVPRPDEVEQRDLSVYDQITGQGVA